MSQHFIENIKIENFKCFENLEINDFKRVNVFGGKNNVGKTALLEAIELLVKSIDPFLLIGNARNLLKRRNQITNVANLSIFMESSNSLTISSNLRTIKINHEIDLSGGKYVDVDFPEEIVFHVDSKYATKKVTASLEDFYLSLKRTNRNSIATNFIQSSITDDRTIGFLYGGVIESGMEGFLNESLNQFDQEIISFKIIPTENKNIPKVKIRGREKLVPLSEMGDGISRYVTILCAIWASQNGFLFIDEIENGIHYSNYKKLWELIFMASEQANCQVFVTTHSKECIEAFNNVQQERNDDTGRYFELYRSEKKQRIVAAVRDAEQLHYSLTHGAAIRGE